MDSVSFYCTANLDKSGKVWVGRCRQLDICTQGESEEDVFDALRDAIRLKLTASQRRQLHMQISAHQGRHAWKDLSLDQVMEGYHAASPSPDHS